MLLIIRIEYYLERVQKVRKCQPEPDGLAADEHVEHGKLYDAHDDEQEVDQGQVDQELVEGSPGRKKRVGLKKHQMYCTLLLPILDYRGHFSAHREREK